MKFAKEVGTAFWGNFSALQQLLCKRHVLTIETLSAEENCLIIWIFCRIPELYRVKQVLNPLDWSQFLVSSPLDWEKQTRFRAATVQHVLTEKIM